MVLRRTRLLFLLILSCLMLFGCGDSAERQIESEAPSIESGKVAQVYVRGAMIIADESGAGDVGNFNLDEHEVFTYSGAFGDYKLEVPAHYGNYVLYSMGGTVAGSDGKPMPAFPMLAPAGAANITPVTTLIAYNPELKAKINGAYDVDIASGAGVSKEIMGIAKTAEALLAVFTGKNNPILVESDKILAVAEKLAIELGRDGIDLTKDDDLLDAAEMAAVVAISDNTIINFSEVDNLYGANGVVNAVVGCVESVLSAIPDTETVMEDEALQAAYETAVANAFAQLTGTSLAFNPTASVLPFPNDVAWAAMPGDRKGLVTFDPTTASDLSTAALYTAMNNLNIKGLSPNAPIGIPLDGATALMDGFESNVKIVNMTALTGILYMALGNTDISSATPEAVIAGLMQLDAQGWQGIQAAISSPQYQSMIFSKLSVIQDGNYIKAFPVYPLNGGSTYLVYIEDKVDDYADDLLDVNGVRVKQPVYYKFLKSDEPLTGSLAALEELRLSYAPIYNFYLKSLGVGKDDTLEIFTFQTADKTLSLTDFGIMAASIASGDISTLADNLTAGLSYASIADEYAPFDAGTDLLTGLMQNGTLPLPFVHENNTFTSFDITTLQDASPTPEFVPFAIYNGADYTNELLIFQHGFTSQKEAAQALGVNMPIIAMDLPEHGARTAEGMASGAEYLTPNMGQDRVNIYQSIFDMTMMLKGIKAGMYDIDGDGTADTPERIYFSGISMGSITGSMFMAVNYADIEKAVLNVGGANYAAIIEQATNAHIRGLLDSFNLTNNTTTYFVTLGMFQTLLDPCDPVYLASPYYKDKTIIQTAYKDTVVNNIANEILAYMVGGYHYDMHAVKVTDTSSFNASASSDAGWYEFGGKPGMKDNWVNHSFLLQTSMDSYPEAAGYLNQDYLDGAQEAATAQVGAFLQ